MSDSARLPAFQFYPADWASNSKLRRCTHEEKGIWIDVMVILHGEDEYGLVKWPLHELAAAVGSTVKKLRGLVTKGVLKGADKGLVEPFIYTPRSGRKDGEPVTLIPEQDGPLWYSSRMVKDAHIRRVRGAATRFGGDTEGSPDKSPNASPKPAPKVRVGEIKGDGSSSSSSTTERKKEDNLPTATPRSGPKPASLALLELVDSPFLDPNKSQALITGGAIVAGWIDAGASLELDIAPTVTALLAKVGEPVTSWKYFTNAVRKAVATRLEAEQPQSPITASEIAHERPRNGSAPLHANGAHRTPRGLVGAGMRAEAQRQADQQRESERDGAGAEGDEIPAEFRLSAPGAH